MIPVKCTKDHVCGGTKWTTADGQEVPECVPGCEADDEGCDVRTNQISELSCQVPDVVGGEIKLSTDGVVTVGSSGILICDRGKVYERDGLVSKQTTIVCAAIEKQAMIIGTNGGNVIHGCKDGCMSDVDCDQEEQYCDMKDFVCKHRLTCSLHRLALLDWIVEDSYVKSPVNGDRLKVRCSNTSKTNTHSVAVCSPYGWITSDNEPLKPCRLETCKSNEECNKDLVCSTVDGYCVQCLTNDDCSKSSHCEDGYCEDNCNSDDNCRNPDKPNCLLGRCLECKTSAECRHPERSICSSDHVCIDKCITNQDCQGSQACNSDKNCVECVDDSHCEQGYHCRNQICEMSCRSDSDCFDRGTRKVCTVSSRCEECSDHHHCNGSTVNCDLETMTCKRKCTSKHDCANDEYCKEGRCKTKCRSDDHCSENHHCDVYTGLCQTCTSNDHCNATEKCQKNQCVHCEDCTDQGTSCITNKDCGTGKYCNYIKQCVDAEVCNLDADCPEDRNKCHDSRCIRPCELSEGGCQSDVTTCNSNEDCVDGKYCNNNKQCVDAEVCTLDADCPEDRNKCNNLRCIRPCELSEGGCKSNVTTCNANEDCGNGKYCNDSKQCVDAEVCTLDADCPEDKNKCHDSRCTRPCELSEGGCQSNVTTCNSNEDCVDGKYCNDINQCVDAEVCTSDVDCPDDKNKCHNSRCIRSCELSEGGCKSNVTNCNANEDCLTGKYCNDDKQCVDAEVCNLDADCPEDRNKCHNLRCIKPCELSEGGCNSNVTTCNANEDCVDGKYCNNDNECVDVEVCTLDADCPEDRNKCHNLRCIKPCELSEGGCNSNVTTCNANEDCVDGKYCNNDNECVDVEVCTLDADCPEDRNKCHNLRCIRPCDLSEGGCKSNVTTCNANEECGNGKYCNNNNQCVDSGVCASDADCPEDRNKCHDSRCIRPCELSEGGCQSDVTTCNSNEDCVDGKYCNNNKQCVDVEVCTSDADCPEERNKCLDSRCIRPCELLEGGCKSNVTTCNSSEDCGNGKYCSDNKQCVDAEVCTLDTDCPEDRNKCHNLRCIRPCDLSEGGCKSNVTTCNANEECGNGKYCNNNNQCVDSGVCASDADCPEDRNKCHDSRCIRPCELSEGGCQSDVTTCNSNEDCVDGKYCNNNKQCVDAEVCTLDADCPEDRNKCHNSRCIRPCELSEGGCQSDVTTCNSNEDCVDGKYCNNNNQCVDSGVCASDADCPEDRNKCHDSRCIRPCELSEGGCQSDVTTCNSNEDCVDGKYCNNNKQCVDVEVCTLDADCPEDRNKCHDSRCIRPCELSEGGCQSNVTTCNANEECGNGKYCNDSKQCVDSEACTSDADCPEDRNKCNNSKCTRPQLTSCISDDDCADDHYCDNSDLCMALCKSDNDCTGGKHCLTESQVCFDCLQNDHCSIGEKCVDFECVTCNPGENCSRTTDEIGGSGFGESCNPGGCNSSQGLTCIDNVCQAQCHLPDLKALNATTESLTWGNS